MKAAQQESPVAGLARVMSELLDESLRLGADMLDTLGRSRLGEVAGSLQRMTPARRSCGCDVPAPCWMPKALGELTSHVCPGGAATVRLVVTNCTMAARMVEVRATGADAGMVKIAPDKAVIEPMDQAVFVATLGVPADASECASRTALLWVGGCHLHWLRWTVGVHARGGHACHEVRIDDCPDLRHHWYDHFYCQRPCPHDQQRIPGRDHG